MSAVETAKCRMAASSDWWLVTGCGGSCRARHRNAALPVAARRPFQGDVMCKNSGMGQLRLCPGVRAVHVTELQLGGYALRCETIGPYLHC